MPPEPAPNVDHNYSYFPVRVRPESGVDRDRVKDHMVSLGVRPRRYFYPVLSELPMYEQSPRVVPLRNATATAAEILCLPIYPNLSRADQKRVVDALKGAVS